MTLTQSRAEMVNAIGLVAELAPAPLPAVVKALEDKHFAYGFDGRKAHWGSYPDSWTRNMKRLCDAGREAKANMAQGEKVQIVWGRTRYAVAFEKRTLLRLAGELAKMPARYFAVPFTITTPA